jgi:hypothetical protein
MMMMMMMMMMMIKWFHWLELKKDDWIGLMKVKKMENS